MAKVIAVTEAFKSLAEVEARFGLSRNDEGAFFPEWREALPSLTETEKDRLTVMRQRLLYHRADGDLLEGAVMLLVASPLLELAGFYDPPFKMRAEVAVEVTINDGEEILRGRIDVLILQQNFWVLVLEANKTTLSTRSALPQALAYMMANSSGHPTFGLLTNGDDVLFVKLANQPSSQYSLSRVFSLYTVPTELESTLQILKQIGQQVRQ